MKFTSRMKDGGRCVFEVKLVSKAEEDIRIIMERKQRINRAMNLILSEYKTEQIKVNGRSSVQKILRRIIKNTTKTGDVSISVNSFEVIPPK